MPVSAKQLNLFDISNDLEFAIVFFSFITIGNIDNNKPNLIITTNANASPL